MIMVLLALTSAATPDTLQHQGRLLDALGNPLNGELLTTFELFDAAVDGTSVHVQSQNTVFTDGYFTVHLRPIDDSDVARAPLHLETTVGELTYAPRQPLFSTPYALQARSVVGGRVVLSTNPPCDEGGLRWNSTSQSVEVCDGTNWRVITGQTPAHLDGLTDYFLFDGIVAEDARYGNRSPQTFGTVYNATTSPFTALDAADRPQVIEFDGTDDYLREASITVPDSNTWTILMWLYVDAANPSGRSYLYDGQDGGSFYYLLDSSNNVGLRTCNGEWHPGTFGVTGRWTLHAIRSDGDKAYITIDGMSGYHREQAGGGNCSPSAGGFIFGSYRGAVGGSGQYFFNGKLAELAIYDGHFLSNSEVEAIYQARLPLLDQ